MTGDLRQSWSAAGYDENARFVSDLGGEILAWLDPKPGECILDLGCGDGALTEKIAAAGAFVIGIDKSPEFIGAARQRGLDAREMDGQALTFASKFDAVFSNAALHWMTAPEAVLAGIARALKPGGRFVAEFGGHGNVAAIVTALRSAALAFGGDPALANPWFFPAPAEYDAMLVRARFVCKRLELKPRPVRLPTGVEGWLMTFREPFFKQFREEARPAVLAHIIELLHPSLCDSGGVWTADYVRLRVAAVLSG
ncbi:MAG: class I SAM-dependent methyltransferase [Rhodomicrobium sp.]